MQDDPLDRALSLVQRSRDRAAISVHLIRDSEACFERMRQALERSFGLLERTALLLNSPYFGERRCLSSAG